ncbi:MAG: aspartate--tRNA ligase [Acidobacteria bacterium]|nr:aspartate--tRNA ligase [Acidobacteriota bacterium]
MPDHLGDLRRTHTCGALRASDVGQRVVLLGWVHRVRDLGSLVFFDVRDRHGLTQVIARDNPALVEAVKRLRPEMVVAVLGEVEHRDADTVNPKLPTGQVEVVVHDLRLLNDARRPPFQIGDDSVAEETRLRYRYLDLRHPRMQRNLELRHRVAMAIRRYFDSQGFLEIETPILTKSTPEGARDYLVPSRVHPGEFFALPQSPQIFKQILMIAGLDRYFQIVKCFRDEDLRADRQPEFTQVDVEISFANQELVFGLIEPAIAAIFREIGVEIRTPFARLAYADAMARYGSDKPDLRCGMPIQDLSAVFGGTPFGPFREALGAGGVVRGFVVTGRGAASRKELDELVEQARQLGAAGLVWARRNAEGVVQSSILKAVGEPAVVAALDAAGAGPADLLLVAGGAPEATSKVLGQLRLAIAKKQGLLRPDEFAFTWVIDFPLFEWDAEQQRHAPMHHPFTSPAEEDLGRLESAPGDVRAKAYDLVLNGSEIGGGSIRIHDPKLQATIFRLLNISDEEAALRFGFFLEALEHGTPPHGGIALGLDRIVAILAGEQSIREVIAFPKTAAAVDLMSGAPSTVDPQQLRELHLRTVG